MKKNFFNSLMSSFEKNFIFVMFIFGIVSYFLYIYYQLYYESFKSNPSEKEIILFKSEGCGYCKRIKPVWNKLESDFRFNPYISLKEVDISSGENHLVQTLGIEGVPTIYYIKQGSPMKEYNGNRSYEDLKLFIETAIQN